jgi:hypothetical protein
MNRAIMAGITALLVTFTALFTSVTPIGASMIKLSMDDLVRQSDAILIGTVLELLPSKGDIVSHTYTDAVIRPERYLYGGSGTQSIAVRTLGGTNGGVTLWIEDQPKFTIGEENLLFLRHIDPFAPQGIDPQNYYEVAGAVQGKWEHKDGVATSISGEKISISALEEIIDASKIPSSIPMTVTINGLRLGEQAMLRIGSETASLEIDIPLLSHPLHGTDTSLTVDIYPILHDGYYLLLLEAPQKYHRYPKGYAFMVNNSAVVNPTGKAITFSLAPPPIYPEMEAVISLSAPPKEPMSIPEIPLWQRLVEPLAIIGSVIIAGLIAAALINKRKRHS